MPHGYPHGSSDPASMQRTTNTQGQTAPPGFHYMPDGTLMSDIEHAKLYGAVKIIHGFDLDFSDIAAAGETRRFVIRGSKNSSFNLEIKNEDSYYYNFVTKAFQAARVGLKKEITNGIYRDSIKFPAITDDDQYDVYLWAGEGTKHVDYNEVRFGDGSIDINSSMGSNSLLLQKVIYQYTDLTLTISNYSPNGTVEVGSSVTDTITVSRGKSASKIPFKISCAVSTATKSYRIIAEPTANDVLSFIQPVVGSAPEILPGENIYPTVNNTDTVDGDFSAGTATQIVMDTNVADKMKVGDKITIATTALTDTVDGAVSSGVKVVMDNNVATKMAVGDRITAALSGVPHALLTESHPTIVTVAALNPDGDNVKEFSMSQAVAVSDGETLTFTPKCNRELFTVNELNPDSDNVKEFAYVDKDGGTSSRLGLRDGATLSFSNRMNYRWPVNNHVDKIQDGMIVAPGTNVTANTTIGEYKDTVTLLEGTEEERVITKTLVRSTDTAGKTPTVVKGLVTVAPGNIIFDKQQALALAGDTLKVGGYGEDSIYNIYGYRVRFSDLKIELTPITTTTTSVVSNSTSVPIAERNGVMNTISSVSGIGIDPGATDPTVSSGGGATGAGTVVLSVAQTLESGITLTFANAGQTATITGNIEILEAGTADQTLRFDVERLLSIT